VLMMLSVPCTLSLGIKRHSRAKFTRPVQREVKAPTRPNKQAIGTNQTIRNSVRSYMLAMELQRVVGVTLSTSLT
jgi:hypothetical protein